MLKRFFLATSYYCHIGWSLAICTLFYYKDSLKRWVEGDILHTVLQSYIIDIIDAPSVEMRGLCVFYCKHTVLLIKINIECKNWREKKIIFQYILNSLRFFFIVYRVFSRDRENDKRELKKIKFRSSFCLYCLCHCHVCHMTIVELKHLITIMTEQYS